MTERVRSAALITEEDRALGRLADLAAEFIRAPSGIDLTDGTETLIFDPPLTTEERAQLAALVSVAGSAVALTPTEYASVREQMQTLRDLRQLGRNAFMALTAAERDRQLYDAQTATTIVLLALLRD